MAISVDVDREVQNYLLTANINLTDQLYVGSWVRLVQSEHTLCEFFVESPLVYSVVHEFKPTEVQYNNGFIELWLVKSSVPLASLNRNENLSCLPDSCFLYIRIEPLHFSQTKKFHLINTIQGSTIALKITDDELCKHVRDNLIAAIMEKIPFSVVRLGDGEGRLLGFPEFFSINDLIYECIGYQYGFVVFEKLKLLYGFDSCYKGALHLKGLIEQSINSADIVFAPSKVRYCPTSLNEKNLNETTAMAYAAMAATSMGVDKLIPDTFLFFRFFELGYFNDVLSCGKKIVVISHTNICDSISEVFGIEDIIHIKIPGHQSFMKSAATQFPFEFHVIANKIAQITQPCTFLVAAGYLGKHYCHLIKSFGGVAIDIGSLFDSWSGQGRTDAVNFTSHRLPGCV